MRIAHLSDLHVAAAVQLGRLWNKRLTGYANLLLRRGRAHQRGLLQEVVEGVACSGANHVIISGDVSNFALEAEFEMARGFLQEYLPFPAGEVSIVPGNHDVYTRGSWRSGRFGRYFAQYATSDLPELGVELPLGRFPFVRLRGPVAIIGLCSAVPRAPFVASGRLGEAQLDALERALGHPEVAGRTPVIVLHHSPFERPTPLRQFQEGLRDGAAFRALVQSSRSGAVLFGHFHARMRASLGEGVEAFEATSASLAHDDPDRVAGFNLYRFSAEGALESAEAWAAGAQGALAARGIPALAGAGRGLREGR